MKYQGWLAALLLFALTVVARLPARWAVHAVPASVGCEEPAGSLWRGRCARLRVGGMTLGPVSWRLHPLPLLLARAEVDLSSADARLPGSAQLTLRSGGHLEARALRASVPLDSGLLPLFPNGWSGQLELDLNTLTLEAGHIKALQGVVNADTLKQLSPAMPFGSYQLRFVASANQDDLIIGELRDSGGPLAVTGALRLRTSGDYELTGTALARSDATPELVKAVEFLGQADAQGRRPFSLTGTY
jgi:general secretion pathway protein N